MKDSIHIYFEKRAHRELSDPDKMLVDQAEEALKKAHAPYSQFTVGCAVSSGNNIITGNNQENAAYPSGLCAERVALFKAKSESKEPVQTIVVLARNANNEMADAFSCGACRQVMMEYAGLQKDPIRILMRDREGTYIILEDARMLLPFNFDASTLSIH